MKTIYDLIGVNNKPKSINGNFIIKGIVHVVAEDGEFEVLQEEFFYTGLEANGYFLSQSDIDVYLEHELERIDWNIDTELDKCYAVLFKFDLKDTSCWTACGYEYDSEVVCLDLKIIPVDEDANKLYLENPFYQLEG